MSDNEKRAHDFAMAVVNDRLARKEDCTILDLISEYNVAFSEMFEELNKQEL